MEISHLLQHQIIASLKAPHAEKVVDAAIKLWEQMAAQIILIIGKDGFHALYVRSLFLSQPKFPWLAPPPQLSPQTDHRFGELKMCFEGQTPEEISAANSLLLITFADILATLIGEELTATILHSAWGDALTRPGKEFTNV